MPSTGTVPRSAIATVFAIFAFALGAQADDAPPAASPPPTPPASDTTPPANAAPPEIGRSILVVNEVEGQTGDAPAQHLKINDNIVFSEDITTGADAKTVIEFRDGSTFEIGADAVVRIDSFIFNPEESTSHKAVQVTRGVFRYVSGYVASDQDTKITTPAGEMGIRGSVVEGIVDPSVPDFVYVGEGNATFTNSAGNSDLAPGASIAVPSATTAPMAAAAMPAAVAAQAVQVIERRLPPRSSFEGRLADDAWLKQTGSADLVPIANQHQAQTAVPPRPLPAPPAHGSLASELGLLTEGNRVNLFHGGQGPRTPEQTAFVARAARDNPRAAVILQSHQLQAQTIHRVAMTAGTALVIRGIGRAGPPAEVMQRITAASIRANPGAAAAINRHVTEAYHGPERGGQVHANEHNGATVPVRPLERNGGTVPAHPLERNIAPHAPPENHQFHANPQNPVPHPPGQPNNLGPKLPQQGPAPRPPGQPNNLGPKLPQQSPAPRPPGQPNNFGPKLPQQGPGARPPGQPNNFGPKLPQQRNFTQPPRNFTPRPPPPRAPAREPPKKKADEQQR